MASAPDERILFIPDADQLGGAERSCLALVRWMHGQGLPCRVLTYSDRVPLRDHVNFPLLETELLPGADPKVRIRSLKTFFAGHPLRYRPLCSGIQAAIHASMAGVRGFHTLMHDTPSLVGDSVAPRGLKGKLRWKVNHAFLRRGLNAGGTTIVTSEFLRDESKAYWNPPVEIHRMGGLSGVSQVAPRRPEGTLRMLSVSRVEANKRIDWMVRALAEMEKAAKPLSERIDWHLDVAGKGSLIDSLKELAHTLGIGDRVHFHGFVSDERVDELYRDAHIFLMPAVQGYGIPAIEALTRGLPVLLHRESGVSDILRDTPWCVVIEGDEPAMRPGLEKIVDAVLRGDHLNAPPPRIPTEPAWAEGVARTCGWLD